MGIHAVWLIYSLYPWHQAYSVHMPKCASIRVIDISWLSHLVYLVFCVSYLVDVLSWASISSRKMYHTSCPLPILLQCFFPRIFVPQSSILSSSWLLIKLPSHFPLPISLYNYYYYLRSLLFPYKLDDQVYSPHFWPLGWFSITMSFSADHEWAAVHLSVYITGVSLYIHTKLTYSCLSLVVSLIC